MLAGYWPNVKNVIRSRLALVNFLLPLITVHLSYLLAAFYGHIEWCMPYYEDCTSISATGRQLPEYLVFKVGMISAGATMAVFWRLNRQWLHWLGDSSGSGNWIAGIGLVAGVSLIFYTLALGHEGAMPYVMRRIGVVFYFGLSYVCQCMLILRLSRLPVTGLRTVDPRLLRIMRNMLVILLCMGITMVLLDVFTEWKDRLERPLEWTMALLLIVNYGLLGLAWKRSGFTATAPGSPS